MKPVRFLQEARLEFLADVVYYEQKERGLGERFRISVEAAVQLISNIPAAGARWKYRTLRVFPKNFPYSIAYRNEDDEIIIFAVSHFRRKPGYWRQRAGEGRAS